MTGYQNRNTEISADHIHADNREVSSDVPEVTIRERFEKEEHQRLSRFASFSDQSRGRDVPETESDIRTIYQRDRDRIIHSKSFRRLKHKTQVFLSPYGDHYRTRLTHTLEVAQIARTIAKAIRANEDLTEAIALGHDLGHTPFGHAGERALTAASGAQFKHSEQSARVVEKLEKNGRGLNLTWEVRDGFRNHGTRSTPATLEGDIVRISDKVAYVNHDIDDGIRAGILTEEMLPEECVRILGRSTRDRINTMILDIVKNSEDVPKIAISEEVSGAFFKLREFMFEELYLNPVAKSEEKKAEEIVVMLYRYYFEHPEEMTQESLTMLDQGESRCAVTCDYIAGMTDNYAVDKFQEIFIPKSWR